MNTSFRFGQNLPREFLERMFRGPGGMLGLDVAFDPNDPEPQHFVVEGMDEPLNQSRFYYGMSSEMADALGKQMGLDIQHPRVQSDKEAFDK